MKKWSIRTKITLLFTVALTLMATLSCLDQNIYSSLMIGLKAISQKNCLMKMAD